MVEHAFVLAWCFMTKTAREATGFHQFS